MGEIKRPVRLSRGTLYINGRRHEEWIEDASGRVPTNKEIVAAFNAAPDTIVLGTELTTEQIEHIRKEFERAAVRAPERVEFVPVWPDAGDVEKTELQLAQEHVQRDGLQDFAQFAPFPDTSDVEALVAEIAMLKDELATANRRVDDAESEAKKERHNAQGADVALGEAAAREAQLRTWADADHALEYHMAHCKDGCDISGLCDEGERLAKVSEAAQAAALASPASQAAERYAALEEYWRAKTRYDNANIALETRAEDAPTAERRRLALNVGEAFQELQQAEAALRALDGASGASGSVLYVPDAEREVRHINEFDREQKVQALIDAARRIVDRPDHVHITTNDDTHVRTIDVAALADALRALDGKAGESDE